MFIIIINGAVVIPVVLGLALCVGYLASHDWLEAVDQYPLPKLPYIITPPASFEEVVWVRPNTTVYEDDPSSLTRALREQFLRQSGDEFLQGFEEYISEPPVTYTPWEEFEEQMRMEDERNDAYFEEQTGHWVHNDEAFSSSPFADNGPKVHWYCEKCNSLCPEREHECVSMEEIIRQLEEDEPLPTCIYCGEVGHTAQNCEDPF